MRLKEEGPVRALGAGNFPSAWLADFMAFCGGAPQVDFLEASPLCQQGEAPGYPGGRHVQAMALSPIGAGAGELFSDPQRMGENICIFGFELTAGEMAGIAAPDRKPCAATRSTGGAVEAFPRAAGALSYRSATSPMRSATFRADKGAPGVVRTQFQCVNIRMRKHQREEHIGMSSAGKTTRIAPAQAKPAKAKPAQVPFAPIPAFAASAAMFLACMDTLITNLALPAIQGALGGNMASQQWIVDGYTLPFAALLLLAGNMSDRFGAKRAFIVGTAGFAAASAVCSLATSVEMLIFGRAVMGVAAAIILPSSMSLINEAYPDASNRSRALALWGIGGSAAGAAGPLFGGVLVPIHWSLVFSVNIPVCLIVLLACTKLKTSPTREKPFDAVGQALALMGLTSLVAGIIEGGTLGFSDTRVVALIAVGLVALAAFVYSQSRVKTPMMPLTLFRTRGMRVAVAGGFVMIFNWNALVFLATLYLQQELGLSTFVSGLLFIPSAVVGTAGNMLSDRIGGARGSRFTALFGFAIIMSCYAVLFAFGNGLSEGVMVFALCLCGLGGGTTTPTLANLVLRSAGAEEGGIASAVFNTMRQVGGAVGIALFGVIVTVAPSFGAGLTVCFAISTVLTAIALALATTLPRRQRG